jgi:hypothetical protein
MWQKIIQWSRFKNKQKGKEKTESRKQLFLFFAQYRCSSSSLHHSRRSASLQLAAAICYLSVPTPLSAVTSLCQYQYHSLAVAVTLCRRRRHFHRFSFTVNQPSLEKYS